MRLPFNINFQSRFEVHSEVVLEYGDLLKPAFCQGFIKLGEGGVLVVDVILQLIDASYLSVHLWRQCQQWFAGAVHGA